MDNDAEWQFGTEALILLQLQKDTYSEARNMSKGLLISIFRDMNVVKTNIEEQQLEDKINLETNGNVIEVGGVKGRDKIVPSFHITEMIRKQEAPMSKTEIDKTN